MSPLDKPYLGSVEPGASHEAHPPNGTLQRHQTFKPSPRRILGPIPNEPHKATTSPLPATAKEFDAHGTSTNGRIMAQYTSSSRSHSYRSKASGKPSSPSIRISSQKREGGNLHADSNTNMWISLLERIEEALENAAGLRLQVQEKRQELRIKREAVSNSDRLFMDELYRWRMESTVKETQLVDLHEKCQAVRREVGPTEDDYEPLELRLGEVEFDATQEVQALLQRLRNQPLQHDLENGQGSSIISSISFESPSQNSDRLGLSNAFNVPTALVQESSAHSGKCPETLKETSEPKSSSGSLGQLRRRPYRVEAFSPAAGHQELGHRESLDSDNIIAAMWDPIIAHPGTTSPLNESPGNMRLAEEIVSDLDPTRPNPMKGRIFEDDDDIKALVSFKADASDESILDNQYTLSRYLREFNDPHSRVNQWLLHCLRISYFEANRLKEEVLLHDVLNKAWPQKALHLWDKDPAAVRIISPPDTEISDEEAKFARQDSSLLPNTRQTWST